MLLCIFVVIGVVIIQYQIFNYFFFELVYFIDELFNLCYGLLLGLLQNLLACRVVPVLRKNGETIFPQGHGVSQGIMHSGGLGNIEQLSTKSFDHGKYIQSLHYYIYVFPKYVLHVRIRPNLENGFIPQYVLHTLLRKRN